MHFEIKQERKQTDPDRGRFKWTLYAKHGAVCRSAESFETEAIARGDVADAKRSMGAARYAKVEVAPL